MKIYVDKKEEDLIEDSLYADNTRLISKFNHEESELEYDDCELIDIGIHDRQVREEVVEEIKEKFNDAIKHHFCPNPSSVDFITLCISEVEEFLDQVKGENMVEKDGE